MLVTLLGIVTLVRREQPENACFPMLVTLSGSNYSGQNGGLITRGDLSRLIIV
jgi:hypothetical protein